MPTTRYVRIWNLVSIDIDKMTVDELVALNHRIVQRLKMLDSLDAHKAMMEFNPGARVSFDSPKDGRLLGTLVKFNRKTVTVITDNGQQWNISPHLLSPVKDVSPANNIIHADEQDSG